MPSEFDDSIFYQHNDRSSVLPTSECRGGRILVPTVFSPEEAFSVLTHGYDVHGIDHPEDVGDFKGGDYGLVIHLAAWADIRESLQKPDEYS